MPAFTPFLNLYKPGGGSTGAITPDEVVDIDRINQNMDSIDAFAQGADSRLDDLELAGTATAIRTTGTHTITGTAAAYAFTEVSAGSSPWWTGANPTRLTVVKGGLYLISVNARAAGDQIELEVEARVNGAATSAPTRRFYSGSSNSPAYPSSGGSFVQRLSDNDYVELFLRRSAGTDRPADNPFTWLQLTRIAP